MWGRKTKPRVSFLWWDILMMPCIFWTQPSQAPQRLGPAGELTAGPWRTALHSNLSGQMVRRTRKVSFFLLLSIPNASCLEIFTDNLVTENVYTCQGQPGFHPYLSVHLRRGIHFQTRRRAQFSWPCLSLNSPLSARGGRHPTCKVPWGRSISPRGAGHRLTTRWFWPPLHYPWYHGEALKPLVCTGWLERNYHCLSMNAMLRTRTGFSH